MDAYNARQDRYLGSVVGVVRDLKADSSQAVSGGRGAIGPDVALSHEEGHEAGHAEHRAQEKLGEEMGPVPTEAFGNTGPRRQSAPEGYATQIRDLPPDVSHFLLRPDRLNLGPLAPTVKVSVSAVLSISMERVVLDWD
jgi:hypothetical protein